MTKSTLPPVSSNQAPARRPPRTLRHKHSQLAPLRLSRPRPSPGLSIFVRTLILLISARPSSRFNHYLRYAPPTASAALAEPCRRSLLRALEICLRLPAGSILESSAASGTLEQSLLPARLGGVNTPDPVLLAAPCALGCTADTLPILRLDPYLSSILVDTASWPTCSSPLLRQLHAAFYSVTALPTFADLPSHMPDGLQRSVASLLCNKDGHYDLSLLHLVAGRHSQQAFTNAVFSAHYAALLSDVSALTTLARARIRHASHAGAHALLSAYYLPSSIRLTDRAAQFFFCHRLGVPLPYLPVPPPRCCHPACRDWPPSRPVPPDHPLSPLLCHAYHACGCGAGGFRHRRHDALIRIIAETARQQAGFATDDRARLSSSSTSNTKVDLVVTSYDRSVFELAIDATVSCPLLPAYLSAAAANSSRMFDDRAALKDSKHLEGCRAQGRAFLPIVFSSLGGIGPPPALEWLDSLFLTSFAAERAACGNGVVTSRRRALFYQRIQASLTRATADMTLELPNTSHAPHSP